MNPITSLPSGGAAVLWGVITFSLLVFLHEGGHFFAARVFGLKVHEFMLGLPGPALRWRSKRSGTAYGVTAFPLGGYVRIAGMEPGEEDALLTDAYAVLIQHRHIDAARLSDILGVPLSRATALLVTLEDYGAARLADDRQTSELVMEPQPGEEAADTLARIRQHTYRGQPIWKRVTILAMGVIVNIVAAVVILTAALSIIGIPTPTLRVAAVTAAGAAEKAGVRVGDTVVSLDGRAITEWAQLKAALGKTAPGQPLDLGLRRDGATLTLRVVPTASQDGTGAVLGVMADQTNVPMPFASAMGESLSMTGQVFLAVVRFFDPKTFGSSIKDARSVVGISYEVASAAEQGPLAYAWMVALLSLSLGVMNILPIPPLDGGKIVLEFIEAIAHRPVPRKLALALSAAGTLLLFSLIFYLMYADVLRYVVPKG